MTLAQSESPIVRPPVTMPRAQVPKQDLRNANAVSMGKDYTAFCKAHPLLTSRAWGWVTPGGTITLNGACYGTTGSVQMLGAFPNGAVDLVVNSWSDETVVVTVPPMPGVPSQAVRLQLIGGLNLSSTGMRQGVARPIRSDTILLKFYAGATPGVSP